MDNETSTRLSRLTQVPLTQRRSERIYVCMPVTLKLQPETVQVIQSASTVDLTELGARVRTNAQLYQARRSK